jgi:hypothetical protein
MSFIDNKTKVLSFMERVQEEEKLLKEEAEFQNSTDYKLKVLDQERQKCKNYCLDEVLGKIYKDAVPLSGEYKQNNLEDLNASFKAFLDTRPNGKDTEWYVKEGIKKGSPFAKRLMEAVDGVVSDIYDDKAMNIEDIDASDLVFKSDEALQKKLDIVGQELSVPEISQAVQDNVKQTALSEISRAKQEKETLKNLEKELAGDASLTTKEAVEEALTFREIGVKKDFEPSLFGGIMINKLTALEKANPDLEDKNIYGALTEYGKDTTTSPKLDEIAFIEAVEEYTGISMVKALKLESFSKDDVYNLAQKYAMTI